MFPPYSSDLLPIVIIGFVVAFILAFGIGANDVANSFGTSVGARVLTHRQACLLASIFEILGAILIGGKVSQTIRQGMIDPELFDGQEKQYCVGLVSTLGGCCIWLLVATFLKLPVSGTHSIVGSTIGFALVAKGFGAIKWLHVLKIVASWFISPLLCGAISVLTYLAVRRLILNSENPFESGLLYLPFFYSITILINVFSVLMSGPSFLFIDSLSIWLKLAIVAVVGLAAAIFVRFVVVPKMRQKIMKEVSGQTDNSDNQDEQHDDEENEQNITSLSRSFLRSFVKEPCREPVSVECQVDYITLLSEQHLPNQPTQTSQKVQSDSAVRLPMHQTLTYSERALPIKVAQSKSIRRGYRTTTVSSARDIVLNYRRVESAGDIRTVIELENLNKLDSMDEGALEEYVDAVVLETKSKKKREDNAEDPREVRRLFSFLQILTAIFGSFAHGGNDVSNAIGPLIALWLVYTDGHVRNRHTPIWVLFFGGVGILFGLWIWGRRVIKTIGEDLTKITPSLGFVIEISTAFTVLFASNLSIPVSTTHCKVGSVVFTGRVRSKKAVDWRLFVNIIVAWVATLPVTGILTALLTKMLQPQTQLNTTLEAFTDTNWTTK
ncbi:hypothetical protein ACOME3_004092 [Neoechinorhynchus agilis]